MTEHDDDGCMRTNCRETAPDTTQDKFCPHCGKLVSPCAHGHCWECGSTTGPIDHEETSA